MNPPCQSFFGIPLAYHTYHQSHESTSGGISLTTIIGHSIGLYLKTTTIFKVIVWHWCPFFRRLREEEEETKEDKDEVEERDDDETTRGRRGVTGFGR